MPRRRLTPAVAALQHKATPSWRETLVRQDAISFEIGIFETEPE